MQWFLMGIGLFVGAGFVIKWLSAAEPKDVRKLGAWAVVLVLVLLAGWLLLTGKLAAMVAALVAAIPFVARILKIGLLWPLLRRMFGAARSRGGAGRSSGRSGVGSGWVSEIKTNYLHMYLDHDNGQLGGTIVRGAMAGRDVDTLGVDELQSFYVECCGAQDQSQIVLETYLDRRPDCSGWRNWQASRNADDHGNGKAGQNNEQAENGFRSGEMDAGEARKILGVADNATREEINRAYQVLIKAVHPDHGGSDYLASKINAARSLLLQLCKD
ncbi:J domain-containing protein [Thalassospira alkalitolerans]|uniref:J domain-containing protein n=1 Tax=Thalassospira alkalitolerans TaxID=1293890 RepID=UPI003AA99D38